MSDEILDPDAPSDAEWLPVRAAMRDVAVPAEAREFAISAALAAFDELHGEVPVAAAAAAAVAADRPADVVSLQTRMGSRWTRWVGSAAAAVAVLAVGGVVINGMGGSSNDQVSIEPTAAVESAFATDTAKMAEVTAENATEMAPVPGTAAPLEGPNTSPTIGSIESGAEADTTIPQVVVAMAPTEEVASTDELTEYATRTAAAPPMANLPDSTCSLTGSEIIGVVTFQGVTAIVVRNADSSYSAIGADTCTVLATVTP
jgi:hypothetical protein